MRGTKMRGGRRGGGGEGTDHAAGVVAAREPAVLGAEAVGVVLHPFANGVIGQILLKCARAWPSAGWRTGVVAVVKAPCVLKGNRLATGGGRVTDEGDESDHHHRHVGYRQAGVIISVEREGLPGKVSCQVVSL